MSGHTSLSDLHPVLLVHYNTIMCVPSLVRLLITTIIFCVFIQLISCYILHMMMNLSFVLPHLDLDHHLYSHMYNYTVLHHLLYNRLLSTTLV